MAASGLSGDVKAVFVVSAVLMVAAGLIDNSAVAWLLSPVILGGLIYSAARAPLRYSLLALIFCVFTIDYPNESLADGLYQSPLYKVGAALFDHLNNLTGIKPLFFSGSDILIGVLAIVGIMREKSGSRIDREGRVATPKPLVHFAQISLLGAGYVWLSGLARGGDFSWSLWQLQKVVYLPIIFLLCHLGLRGPKDHVALAKVLLTAATLRAVLAFYIVRTVPAPLDPMTGLHELAAPTGHADSMLFASAFAVLVLLIAERAGKKSVRLALLLLPILMLGMISNHRRLVWVHVLLILLVLYFATPDNPVKRKFRRTLLASSSLIALYLYAGWNSHYGTLFKPARMARSVVEPETDGSSLWRELENFNLITTVKDSPILGHGYGHRFIEAVPLPYVNYSLEYYCPHNSLLGLWAFAGYVGYTAITLMWGIGVFFAMRAYHSSKAPFDRVAAVVSVGAVLVYLVQAFGDLGLGSLTGVYILAPALAIGGKLAVANGAWGGARKAQAAGVTPSGVAGREIAQPQPAHYAGRGAG